MEYIRKFIELEKYFEKADFTDVKVFEGDTTLREFIASMLSYYLFEVVWAECLYQITFAIICCQGTNFPRAPKSCDWRKSEIVLYAFFLTITVFSN